MRVWIAGPRLFGGLIRPGISFSPSSRSYAASAPALEAPEAFVYVIRGSGETRKIGVSRDPQSRLAQLQTGSATPLSIEFSAPVYGASAYEVEGETHNLLAGQRLVGEWFAVSLNIAVAAIYGAAERVGASMQPRAVAGGRRGVLGSILYGLEVAQRLCVGLAALVLFGGILLFVGVAIWIALGGH